jgi:hypothetical protein
MRPTAHQQVQKIQNYGATRRDRTGDLLITKFHIRPHAIDITFGPCPVSWAYSASRALIESDFESEFFPERRPSRQQPARDVFKDKSGTFG